MAKGTQLTTHNGLIMAWLRSKCAFRTMIGWCFERIGTPARLKEFELVDPETNETIYLSTGLRYSVLHIRGKRLFFDRITGTLDGTCTSLQDSVANRLELSD